MVTRSMHFEASVATWYPLPLCYTASIAATESEPNIYSQVSKHHHWSDAMSKEFQALVQNKTWNLVPYHSSMNVVGSKWVYKIKQKPDGSVDRYKDRLVAQGFTQILGVDFFGIVSPVIKPTTIRTILSLAVSH
ncbi:PREDICTED: uncharacterized protein LOC109114470 [Nelumbo nucifera]|uniref:Uncharacterized protein LOC109114470 n=1 Tax=Nelumbo nucifera TaxID=4432 RepID=A0A1U8Q1H8_NELNU|nr:PREDICTED: uncharacterized protein LOC109114470 [Nelumbo nucifera]